MTNSRFQHTISLTEQEENEVNLLIKNGIKFTEIFRAGKEYKLKELGLENKANNKAE